ncbi:hypothetical protein P154DRAFT_563751, partial [Amniculicola lignicola CBS 123094]
DVQIHASFLFSRLCLFFLQTNAFTINCPRHSTQTRLQHEIHAEPRQPQSRAGHKHLQPRKIALVPTLVRSRPSTTPPRHKSRPTPKHLFTVSRHLSANHRLSLDLSWHFQPYRLCPATSTSSILLLHRTVWTNTTTPSPLPSTTLTKPPDRHCKSGRTPTFGTTEWDWTPRARRPAFFQ